MNDPEETKICYGCIGDPFLKEEVRSEGRRTTCAYCRKRRKSISLDDLADRIHGVLDGHFYLTPSEPEGIEYTMAKEFGWERRGDPVDLFISEIAGLEEAIVKDIQEHLSDRFGYDAFEGGCEDPYGDQAYYEEKGPDASSSATATDRRSSRSSTRTSRNSSPCSSTPSPFALAARTSTSGPSTSTPRAPGSPILAAGSGGRRPSA